MEASKIDGDLFEMSIYRGRSLLLTIHKEILELYAEHSKLEQDPDSPLFQHECERLYTKIFKDMCDYGHYMNDNKRTTDAN